MTRTPQDLRDTFTRHAHAPADDVARLQIVVDKLSAKRTGRPTHHRTSAPMLVSAAVVAVIALVVVVAYSHSTTQPEVLAETDGDSGTSVTTSAAPTPFSLPSVPGKVEFSFPVDQRQMLQPLAGSRLGSDGATLKLSDFAGQVVVINVWASWCAPCRSESPQLRAAYTELSPAGVQFIGVDIKDTTVAAQAAELPYPSIFDPAQKASLGTPLNAIPMTIVLDKHHLVAHLWLQPITHELLTDVVRGVLAEK